METKEKKQKRALPRFDFASWTKEQKRAFALFALALCAVLLAVAVISFFIVLRGPEKVMMPDVRSMDLADALVKLQERELYPRVTLRFTDNPQDKNTILEQSPEAGSIVKAGRRVKLTVSKGAVLDKIENYVGKDLEAVKLQLQSAFSTTKALITIREPAIYRNDDAPAGTILEQKPLPGEQVSGPTILELIVSLGPESAKAQVPSFVGLSMAEAVAAAEKAPFTVDFSLRQAKQGEAQGQVVEQQPKADAEEKVSARVKVVVSAPAPTPGMVSGLYVHKLQEYPYPVAVKLEAIKPSGQRSLVASLKHPGGNFSVPFSLPEGSTLVLSALDREVSRSEVKKQ